MKPQISPTAGATDSSARHLLLVEDSYVNQMVAVAMLKKAGYVVDTAVNGLEAIAAVQARKYDLVLMDLAMPEMDGFQAAAEIRRMSGAAANVPIIAVTANGLDQDWQRCIAVGMNDYISKPINRVKLLSVLEQWLQGSPAGNTGANAENQNRCGEVRQSEMPQGEVLDAKTLQQLEADTDKATLQRAVHLFIRETKARLQVIVEAGALEDWNRVQREAHTLKSSAGAFGAQRLQEHAQALDQACRKPDRLKALALVARLAEVTVPVLQVLTKRYC